MKKKIRIIKLVISILIVQLTFINCEDNHKVYHLNDIDFSLDKLDNNYSTDLNFGLKDSLFIEDLQQKIKIDFCKKSNINLNLEFKNVDLIVPVHIFNRCPDIFKCGRYMISYLINKNDNVLIEDEYIVNQKENSSLILAESIKKYIEDYNKKNIVINFNWAEKTKVSDTKKRFKELINGIYIFRNQKSKKIFGNDIKDITVSEKDSLNADTQFTIIIAAFDFPPPPPPPPGIDEIDILEIIETEK